MQPKIHFFIGKGGVGKSTASALTALFFAAAGRETLLVSMDPAHNQRDIFETDFSEKPRNVNPRLAVQEVDTDGWIARYLKQTREHIRKTYVYESAFNLQDHFKVLQFSPGLEEYALVLAFENVLHRFDHKDVIIFDMAPTALTLRFFSLPSITLLWLDELLKLRNRICEKKEIISRVRIGSFEKETDRVKAKLQTLINSHTHLREHFQAATTRINLVVNNDRLSVSEAVRIRRRLAGIGMGIDRVVVNKVKPGEPTDAIAEAFQGELIARLALAPIELLGLPVLEKYMAAHPEAFGGLRP